MNSKQLIAIASECAHDDYALVINVEGETETASICCRALDTEFEPLEFDPGTHLRVGVYVTFPEVLAAKIKSGLGLILDGLAG